VPDIIIKTQAEWDALPDSFTDYTRIEVRSSPDIWLTIKFVPKNAVAVLRESSHAVLWESSHAELWESSHAELWGSSHAVLRESSHAVLWESSHAELWESSHAELWGSTSVHQRSTKAPTLNGHSACFLHPGYAVPILASTTAMIINVPAQPSNTAEWLDANGVVETDRVVVLYKRVSKDFLTQEGEPWQATWAIGEVKEHPSWEPTKSECGAGKFHACSRPYFCDEFRSVADDRYVALRIEAADLYAWPNAEYAHKIAFRKAVVLFECDRYGKEIKP
jgi:hypothetical protein